MKKVTVKKQLVDFMITNGNDFTYTDVIKATLRICKGDDHKYDWRVDRGFYATNFSVRGYMVNGGGTCGVYKKPNGKWSAKYYTPEEIFEYKIKRIIFTLVRSTKRIYNEYEYISTDLINDLKESSIKSIVKLYKK
jgi:hypothetical protein